MKKKYLYLILIFLQINLSAHSVLLDAVDNEDGTMEVMGGFTTGASATGSMLRIESKISLKILYKNRIPESGSLMVKIPNEPYQIVLDSGPGHIITKDGLIEPEGGFTAQIQDKPLQIAYNITFGISILFIVLSIIVFFIKRNKKEKEI